MSATNHGGCGAGKTGVEEAVDFMALTFSRRLGKHVAPECAATALNFSERAAHTGCQRPAMFFSSWFTAASWRLRTDSKVVSLLSAAVWATTTLR